MPQVDPSKILREAKELAERGRYEEALQKHLWFHDHALEHQPAAYGVRLSFALAEWVSLGGKYPPALEALIAIRDRRTGEIRDGKGSKEQFHDVTAINRYLEEEEKTAALFNVLHESDPALAAQCYNVVEELLVRRGEYDICIAYSTDFIRRFERIRDMRRMQLELGKENPLFDRPEMLEYVESSYASGVSNIMDILKGVGRHQDAERLRALAIAENPDVQAALER